jgi:hypothetical protein
MEAFARIRARLTELRVDTAIASWLVAMGAVKEYECEVLCHEPIRPWVTGTAMVEFRFSA